MYPRSVSIVRCVHCSHTTIGQITLLAALVFAWKAVDVPHLRQQCSVMRMDFWNPQVLRTQLPPVAKTCVRVTLLCRKKLWIWAIFWNIKEPSQPPNARVVKHGLTGGANTVIIPFVNRSHQFHWKLPNRMSPAHMPWTICFSSHENNYQASGRVYFAGT